MDKRLLWTLINAARTAQPEYQNKRTWVFLTEVMGIGSGRAFEICKEFGFDPEVKAKEIKEAEGFRDITKGSV
jgi:ribosomal protein S13